MSRKKGCTEFMVWSSVELQEIKAVDNTQEKNAKSKNVNQAVDDPGSNYEKVKMEIREHPVLIYEKDVKHAGNDQVSNQKKVRI